MKTLLFSRTKDENNNINNIKKQLDQAKKKQYKTEDLQKNLAAMLHNRS